MSSTNFVYNFLAYGLVAGLTACGGQDPAPAPVPRPAANVQPTAPVELPAPQTVGGDYVRDTVAPWLESYYGRIQLQTTITVLGPNNAALDTLSPGEYSWRDIYDRVVNKLAQACSCSMNIGQIPTANVSPFSYLDYTRFSHYVSVNAMNWQQASVLLRPTWSPNQMIYANFAFIFHQLVSMNHTYYTQYYYPVLYRGLYAYNPGAWAFGNYYGPSNALSLGFGYNSYSNGQGGGRSLRLNVGGFFQGF